MVRHDFVHGDERNNQASIGIREAQIGEGSGLRVMPVDIYLPHAPDYISGPSSIELPVAADPAGFDMVATTTWTDFSWTSIASPPFLINQAPPKVTDAPDPTPSVPPIELVTGHRTMFENQFLPYPCTPYFKIDLRHGVDCVDGKRVRFECTGWDQFGNGQREITPWITITRNTGIVGAKLKLDFHGWFAKVFSRVERIRYQFDDVGAANIFNRVSFGCKWMPFRAIVPAAATSTILGTATVDDAMIFYNQGLGLPLVTNGFPMDPTGAVGPTANVGTTDGPGYSDVLSGWLENKTSGVKDRFPPYQESAQFDDGEAQVGGWFTDGGDVNLGWESGRGKIHCELQDIDTATKEARRIPMFQRLGVGPAAEIREGLPAGPSPTAWTDEFVLHLWVRTTWGRGQAVATDGYPDYMSAP